MNSVYAHFEHDKDSCTISNNLPIGLMHCQQVVSVFYVHMGQQPMVSDVHPLLIEVRTPQSHYYNHLRLFIN